jgi:hypothetical protein
MVHTNKDEEELSGIILCVERVKLRVRFFFPGQRILNFWILNSSESPHCSSQEQSERKRHDRATLFVSFGRVT